MNSSGSGSSWETAECFRHQALGTEVMLFTSTKDEYDTFIAFGILGCANITFKDKKKQYKDASDINLWRIRYGYADVLLT